jgi:hypothetical protein
VPAPPSTPDALAAWIAAAVGLVLLALLLARRGNGRRPQAAPVLSEAERRAALQRVQGWLLQSAEAVPGPADRVLEERP